MALNEYNKKRNFKSTSEPVGKIKKKNESRFVIQYHEARAKHYDFRLEYKGVLISWAVPKGLPVNVGDKRLAVHVEDHPVEYIDFSGTIPKGQYGAGTVEVFDNGKYVPISNFKSGFVDGNFKFYLLGKKLHGVYTLVKKDEKNWFIIKCDGEHILSTKTRYKIPFLKANVQLAVLSTQIPRENGWLFEIKYDGYRILSFMENGKATLLTRNLKDFSKKFFNIKEDLEKLFNMSSAVLDGEIVVFDDNGKSDFSKLQQSIKENLNNACYVVFDILSFNGVDLRDLPLISRKEILKDILLNSSSKIIYSEHVIGQGEKCFEFTKKNNLEGIIAKYQDSLYLGERNEDWLKIKCYKRQEFVICGYTVTQKNELLSSIIVGYYKNGALTFAGKVGTGFNEEQKQRLNALFKKIIIKDNNINEKPSDAILIKPKYVAEIQFAELTKNKILRQPSFIALREDKNPKEIVLEMPYE